MQKYNYPLDTELLPQVWLTWATTKNKEFDKRYWLNCQTNEQKDTPEKWMRYNGEYDANHTGYGIDNENRAYLGARWAQGNPLDKIWTKSGSNVTYIYAKYHKDIDRLELAAAKMDTSRRGDHKWAYEGDRFFIGRDKSIVDQNGLIVNGSRNMYGRHWAYSKKEVIRLLLRLAHPNSLLSEFKKFIGAEYFTIGDGKTVSIRYSWHLSKWYETVQKTRGTGKEQKLVDKLVAMPLKDASNLGRIYPAITIEPKDRWSSYNKIPGIVYFERVDNEWCVLRSFVRQGDYDLQEEWRMYISEDGKTRIASKTLEGWVPSKQILNDSWRHQSYFANKIEAITNCKRIKYILDNANVGINEAVNFLVSSLRFPELEQISKFGYAKIAASLAQSHTIKSDLKERFGGYYDTKEKNLLRKVGLTKAQFDIYMSDRQDSWAAQDALKLMRQMFGDNLSYLDIKSFEKYYNGCVDFRTNFYGYRDIEYYIERYDLDKMKFFKNLVRLKEKRSNVFQIAKDTLSLHSNLHTNIPDIDWYFDDVSDLVRAHDVVTDLERIEAAERRAMWNMAEAERKKKEEETRQKLDKERKVYEYEDDKYIIRLPKDANEIVAEGSKQHICIGGYVSNHSMGRTNLFFLREKENEDTPFYAIEMNNHKVIHQIHGKCNRWLGNNPEAIPTVVRWLRKHDIKCDVKILTCKATGYGQVNQYVPMPIVED